jgi:hypothetical protein
MNNVQVPTVSPKYLVRNSLYRFSASKFMSTLLRLHNRYIPQGPNPFPPPSLRVAKAGRNNLNEEITPLLPTEIGERCSQTISNLGHAALLRRCELPL